MGIDLTAGSLTMVFVLAGFGLLAACLLTGLYCIQNHTVRIYNWNGSRYCYLGRTGLHRDKGSYTVQIGERMADLSYTTLYQICPSGSFVRRNRYSNMMLCAGRERCMMHVDGCMRQSIYYRQAIKAGG